MQGERVQSLVREVRSHMPGRKKNKTENRSRMVTNSIKILIMVYIFLKKS